MVHNVNGKTYFFHFFICRQRKRKLSKKTKASDMLHTRQCHFPRRSIRLPSICPAIPPCSVPSPQECQEDRLNRVDSARGHIKKSHNTCTGWISRLTSGHFLAKCFCKSTRKITRKNSNVFPDQFQVQFYSFGSIL